MTDKERGEIARQIEEYISTDTKEIPQSVVFRSGMNTGLRIAARIVKEYGKDEALRRHNEDKRL